MLELDNYETNLVDRILAKERSYDVIQFWDSTNLFNWLATKGYTLYQIVDGEGKSQMRFAKPRLPFDSFCESVGPYAYHDARPDNSLRARSYTARVMYAQDSKGRHVAIKITSIDSDEYRILHLLSQQSHDELLRHGILPVLELLHLQNACFAVMPRWGGQITEPIRCLTVRDSLCVMHSMLKGLSYLHSHNIIHRDIKIDNVVVSHFGDEKQRNFLCYRGDVLKHVSYALIDYDVSIMAPRDVDRTNFRLPCEESYVGTWTPPADTSQGEFDYNPFAYDVGTMGVEFCRFYQHYTRVIPMLAPFLDRMVTRDVSKRFTAEQALQFFEDEVLPVTTEKELSVPQRFSDPFESDYERYDRWAGVSDDFKQKWAHFREPRGLPITWRFLRWIRRIEWLPFMLIPRTRFFFYKLTHMPYSIWKYTMSILWGL